jgi:uncharacterized membrane protein
MFILCLSILFIYFYFLIIRRLITTHQLFCGGSISTIVALWESLRCAIGDSVLNSDPQPNTTKRLLL